MSARSAVRCCMIEDMRLRMVYKNPSSSIGRELSDKLAFDHSPTPGEKPAYRAH